MGLESGFGEDSPVVWFVDNEDTFPVGDNHLTPTFRLTTFTDSSMVGFVLPNDSPVLGLTTNDS